MYLKTGNKLYGIWIYAAVFILCAVMSCTASALAFNFNGNTTEDMEQLQRTSRAFVEVVKKAKPAVVHIKVSKNSKIASGVDQQLDELFGNPLFKQFFGPYYRQFERKPQHYMQQGQGSGFIISPEGFILTNNHVVDKADEITVTLADNRTFPANLVGSDPQTDVALLKIDDPENLPILPLGDSSTLEAGEWVIAIGNPFGLSQTVTSGVVSATGRNMVGINEYENFIQTDAAINPGNSGGPLLNTKGEVIGINTALFSRSGGFMGIGFAIPINMAKAIEKQLQKYGHVTRGWLGVVIQDMTEDLAQSFGLDQPEGILVSEVQGDSPAAAAGMRAGDIIVAVNGKRPQNVVELRNMVAMLDPQSKATFTLLRNSQKKSLPVIIGEHPSVQENSLKRDKKENVRQSRSINIERFGLQLKEISSKDENNYPPGSGLLITDIVPGSPAAKAGLQRGQLIEAINRRDIHNLKELNRIMPDISSAKKLLLRVRQGEYSTFIVLSLNK